MERIGFIGCGRVGTSFGRMVGCKYPTAFFSENINDGKEAAEGLQDSVTAKSGKHLAKICDMIFITVPDGKIKEVWEDIKDEAEGKVVCHMSGALKSEEAFPGCKKCASVHPMMAVSDKHTDLKKAFFTVEGSGRIEVKRLLDSLKINFKTIDIGKKALYHASCVMASNLVTALVNEACNILEECGFEKSEAAGAVKNLVLGNCENIFEKGFEGALTGPVDRNDIDTVKKHMNVLGKEKDLYIRLSESLVEIAEHKNKNTDYTELRNLLKGGNNNEKYN